MPRRRKLTPSYVLHQQSGRGRAVWYDKMGKRQQQLLPGLFESPESRHAYGRLLLEQEVGPVGASVADKDRGSLTVVEVLDQFHQHATRHYRDADGRPTSTIHEINLVVKSLRELYGDTPAAEFGPLKMKAAMRSWVVEKRSRSEVNRRLGIVKRIFKWAVSEELVPGSVHQSLTTVTGLQRGRTIARETDPIEPVDDAAVDATLPHLNHYLAGMVELQRLTGMRPGEVCIMRRSDIDTGGVVWLYKPSKHKTKYKGKSRIIAIGPKAQAVLKGFFTADLTAYLFPPGAAMEEIRAERAEERKTPRYPSHQKRNQAKRKKQPRRVPREHYDRTSYTRAIARACDLAFPPPAPLARLEGESVAKWKARIGAEGKAAVKKWREEHGWHPNQLRHAYATKVRKEHGLEAAQVLLGHAKADTTQIYAEKNQSLAVSIAAKMG